MKTLYIITGANKGLGKAFYNILIQDKDHNIIASLSRRLAEDQLIELTKPDSNFYFCEVDLIRLKNESPLDSLKKLKKIVDKVVFINNAAIIEPIGLLGYLDSKMAYASIQVNVVAPTILVNEIIDLFFGKKIDLVNISSGAAQRSIEGWSLYCSGKAFAKMLFETVEKENVANPNLRVFQFDPGVMDTDMQKSIRRENSFLWQKDFTNLKDSGKLKDADEVAAILLKEIQSA